MHIPYHWHIRAHRVFVCRRDRYAVAGNCLSPIWWVLYGQVFVRTVSECANLAGKKVLIARVALQCSGVGNILVPGHLC